MKTTLFLITLALLFTGGSNRFLAAAEPNNDAAKLAKGLELWQELKAKCGGDYAYQVRWSSAFGFGHVTEVVVRGNKVAERKYEAFSDRPQIVAPGGAPAKPAGDRWVETGDAIGTHKQGAPAKTLDELYAEAKFVVGKKLEPHQRRYLRFNEAGLPISCFWIDTRIADDAPSNGLRINKIELAAAKEDADARARAITTQFVQAVKKEDAAALGEIVSAPFLDGGRMVDDKALVIADFKSQFERKDFSKITGNVSDLLSFDSIKTKLSGGNGEAMKKLLASGDQLVTLALDFGDGKGDQLLILVNLQQPAAKIVGILDAR